MFYTTVGTRITNSPYSHRAYGDARRHPLQFSNAFHQEAPMPNQKLISNPFFSHSHDLEKGLALRPFIQAQRYIFHRFSYFVSFYFAMKWAPFEARHTYEHILCAFYSARFQSQCFMGWDKTVVDFHNGNPFSSHMADDVPMPMLFHYLFLRCEPGRRSGGAEPERRHTVQIGVDSIELSPANELADHPFPVANKSNPMKHFK